ncbi:MAG: tetratricopeptide repeat protein [Thermoguttaceae bacterium]
MDKGIADLTEAIRLDPKDVGGYLIGRGIVYSQKKQFEQAITDFSEAIQRAPETVMPYFHRGRERTLNGELDKGIADFTEAIRLDPKLPCAYWGRGDGYRLKGDLGMAFLDFGRAVEVWERQGEKR